MYFNNTGNSNISVEDFGRNTFNAIRTEIKCYGDFFIECNWVSSQSSRYIQ